MCEVTVTWHWRRRRVFRRRRRSFKVEFQGGVSMRCFKSDPEMFPVMPLNRLY